MPARFFLARHAESTWNRERRMQGFGDPPLTAGGVHQAIALAERVATEEIRVLVSSDLQRALATASAIARVTGLQIQTDAGWREYDVGVWTGLNRAEIEACWPVEYAAHRARDPLLRPGGGETRPEFEARILEARRRIEERYRGRRVLVVTHRGPIRVLLPQTAPAHAELLEVMK